MHLPPPLSQPAGRRRLLVLAALALLTGCANGDFGEVRSTLVRDDMHDWVGSAAVADREPRSPLELTDDERWHQFFLSMVRSAQLCSG